MIGLLFTRILMSAPNKHVITEKEFLLNSSVSLAFIANWRATDKSALFIISIHSRTLDFRRFFIFKTNVGFQ